MEGRKKLKEKVEAALQEMGQLVWPEKVGHSPVLPGLVQVPEMSLARFRLLEALLWGGPVQTRPPPSA